MISERKKERKKERKTDTRDNGKMKNESCLRWDSNPRHSVFQTDALPTELPRQLSCQGSNTRLLGEGRGNETTKDTNTKP